MRHVSEVLDVSSQKTILVIGDILLDHYVHGQVKRISPEAPVPVLLQTGEYWRLGGAANLAANVAALGAHVVLLGIVGDDADAAHLSTLLRAQERIDARLVISDTHPTIRKTRFVSGNHQIVRVDHETLAPFDEAVLAKLMEQIEVGARTCDAIAVSDYLKGAIADPVFQAIVRAAQGNNKQLIVDPKRADFSVYRGAHYLTPNRAELSQATGHNCDRDDDAERAAEIAKAQTGASILLTRSEQGMSLFSTDGQAIHDRATARGVFDVTGAGDTVIATFTLALASGATPITAMKLANLAAGVVVAKPGAASCSLEELRASAEALEIENAEHTLRRHPPARLLTLEALRDLRTQWGEAGLCVGFTNGCFDLLHPGHIALIDQAASACDRLIVALNSDNSVARLKGPSRPVQSQAARAAVIGALRGVDALVIFDEPTPLGLIEALVPDVLIKGADYREEDIVGADLVKSRGGRILRAELQPGHSTSALIARSLGKDAPHLEPSPQVVENALGSSSERDERHRPSKKRPNSA